MTASGEEEDEIIKQKKNENARGVTFGRIAMDIHSCLR
jgi:hypothetical protein